ncbi:hypothetical protein GCM10018987_10020 [Streptomyces cremeus]
MRLALGILTLHVSRRPWTTMWPARLSATRHPDAGDRAEGRGHGCPVPVAAVDDGDVALASVQPGRDSFNREPPVRQAAI